MGDLAARLLSAQFVSALDYARSLRLRRLVEQDFAAALERVDVIVTPTSVVVAPPADDLRSGVGARTVAWRDVVARTTYPVSLAGLQALSTPVGFTSAGLPIGAQIVAPALRDELGLRVAAAYERACAHGAAAPPVLSQERRSA